MSSVRAGDSSSLVTSALSHHELVYARAVVTYNSSVASGGVKPDLWTEEREPEVIIELGLISRYWWIFSDILSATCSIRWPCTFNPKIRIGGPRFESPPGQPNQW